jgi:hypothetical protein
MTTSLSEYLVLARGRWDAGKSPQEIQQAVDAFSVWYDRMVIAGRVRPGQRLAVEGKLVSRTRIVDGSFAQAREAIGGYWFLLAHSLDEAAALAAENPCLECGLTYEVRPVEVRRIHRGSDAHGMAN